MSKVPEVGWQPTMPVVARRAMALYGDRDLVVMPDRRMTFAEVEVRSRRLAKRLLTAGIGKGSRVALHFSCGPEMLIAYLAVSRIGALVLPFSTAYTPAELRRALRAGDVHTLVVPPRMLGRDQLDVVEQAVPELSGKDPGPHLFEDLPHLRSVWVLGESNRPWAISINLAEEFDAVSSELLDQVEADVSPADWFVVIHTSGSTAEPKGVVHTHGAVFRKTAGGWAIPSPQDKPTKVFAAMPFFWVGGLITIAAALQQGWTLVCLERFEIGEALDLIERERVSGLAAWHGVIQAMREHPTIPHRDLSSIPMLTGQGEGGVAFRSPLGMTETIGPHLELSLPTGATTPPEHLWGSNGSSGPFFDHKLVDPDTGRELGDGEEGEICVRGYAVAAGMYKRERHEVFDEDGYYHTGDRCRLEDGLYFFTGRVTEMIKTRGSNVAPLEVEAVLESFPDVSMAFVVGIPDAVRDEEVVAVVVPVDGVSVDPNELRGRVRLELSGYKVPRLIVTMTEDEVPWLATGKVDKRSLKTLLSSVTKRAE